MSRRIKAEKGARESTAHRFQRTGPEDVTMAEPRDEAPEDDEAAELERVLATIANYPDQPLDAGQEAKLRMAASEISAHNNLYEPVFEDLQETATMLAEAIPAGENVFENEEMIRIRESLLKLIDKQHMAELYVDALDTDVRKPVAAGRPIVDTVSVFDEGVEKRSDTYQSQTARQKYLKAKPFGTFVEGVWEAYHPDEGRPAITEFLPRGESYSWVPCLDLTFLTEAGDVEDSDEEMEVGGVTQDYKCPLTLQIYTDPLTSTVCGHSFTANAIREYVRNNDKCPAQGCDAKISSAVLKQDKALAKKAQAAKRRAQRDEEDDDDDDIDD